MDDLERLLAERECEGLITAYGHLVDSGEAARVADLFADDGVWESAQARMEGRAAVRDGFSQRQANTARRSRHVCTNVAVQVVSDTEATARCYFTLYRFDGAEEGRPAPSSTPAMVGDYVDRFVRTVEGWRFAHRVASAAFVDGGRG